MRRLRGDGRPPRRAPAAAGRRSTPASCRPSRSTGRRSSPPRGSARPTSCTRSRPGSPPRRLPVRLLHARLRLLDGGGVLPARRDGRRARRVRPARDRRQPLPLHRLPPDPRRGPRPRRPRTRDPLAERQAGPRPPRSADPAPTGSPAPPTSPRRSRSWPSTPTPWWSPGRPTGAWRPTCAAAGRRTSSRSTGCPSCAGSRPTRRGRDRCRADPERGRGRARRHRAAARGGLAALRLAADPQRRHHRRQPRDRLADR